MVKNKKSFIYMVLVLFLAGMAVMSVISRVMNGARIPQVETVSPASGNLKLSALGCGVLEFGQLFDARIAAGVFTEDTFYVRGYFYDKEYTQNIAAGDEVFFSVDGGSTVRGVLAAKMYDYRNDVVEVVIFPGEDFLKNGAYEVGAAVDFVREEARVRCACHIPNEVIYEDEDGDTYVYVLKSREGIAGNVTVAVKTQVHVVMRNEARTAIAEELEMSTKIIKKDEALRDGMRVREKEW